VHKLQPASATRQAHKSAATKIPAQVFGVMALTSLGTFATLAGTYSLFF
jgi:hypothetical protein